MSEYQPIDRTGNFRGRIIEYKMVLSTKGSAVFVALRVLITGIWNEAEQQWEDDWEQYQCVVGGMICVVKNDREPNETAIRSLAEAAGWDGKATTIQEERWNPKPIAFTVEENDYKGSISYRIGFVNRYDSTPGSASGITNAEAASFDTIYGPKVRAIASNAVRNASAPAASTSTTKPAPPTAPPATRPEKPNANKPEPNKAPDASPAPQRETIPPPSNDDLPF